MNKMIDAVNDLHGDLSRSYLFKADDAFLYIEDGKNTFYQYGCLPGMSTSNRANLVCTVDEFNQCAAEMSEASWIPERNIETKEEKEAFDKMAAMPNCFDNTNSQLEPLVNHISDEAVNDAKCTFVNCKAGSSSVLFGVTPDFVITPIATEAKLDKRPAHDVADESAIDYLPQINDVLYLSNQMNIDMYSLVTWNGSKNMVMWFNRKLLHTTKDAAIANTELMLELIKNK